MKKILFLASIWGILEATIGWAMHLVHFPAGAVMFPIGMVILLAGYAVDQRRSSLLLIGLIAAAIKLTNLVLPGREFLFNPTASIVIESMLVAVIAPYITVSWERMRVNFLFENITLAKSCVAMMFAIGLQAVL